MFAQVWERVVSGAYQSVEARLLNHARFCVKDCAYPGMIKVDMGNVVGRLYLDVGTGDLAALDNFEGSQYQRDTVEVFTNDGTSVYAETYLFLPEEQLTEVIWEPAKFMIEKFLNLYCSL